MDASSGRGSIANEDRLLREAAGGNSYIKYFKYEWWKGIKYRVQRKTYSF